MAEPRTRLAAWEMPQEVSTCGAAALHHMHHNMYVHREKVESARGAVDWQRVERDAEAHKKRSESMRSARRKNREVATHDEANMIPKLAERLVVVIKDSEKRMKSMMTPRQPTSTHPEAGSMNIGYRRKVARQIDRENAALLERLMKAKPVMQTKSDVVRSYQVHEELVARTSRIRRRHDTDFASESHPRPPATPRPRPPLYTPKQAAATPRNAASSSTKPAERQTPRSLPPMERQAKNASSGSRPASARERAAGDKAPGNARSGAQSARGKTSRKASPPKAASSRPRSASGAARGQRKSPYRRKQLESTVNSQSAARSPRSAARDGAAAAKAAAKKQDGDDDYSEDSYSSDSRSRSSSRPGSWSKGFGHTRGGAVHGGEGEIARGPVSDIAPWVARVKATEDLWHPFNVVQETAGVDEVAAQSKPQGIAAEPEVGSVPPAAPAAEAQGDHPAAAKVEEASAAPAAAQPLEGDKAADAAPQAEAEPEPTGVSEAPPGGKAPDQQCCVVS